jgi:hypothetical protein
MKSKSCYTCAERKNGGNGGYMCYACCDEKKDASVTKIKTKKGRS